MHRKNQLKSSCVNEKIMCEMGEERVVSCKCARVESPPGHTMSFGSCHIHGLEALWSFNRLIFDLLAL